MDFGYHVGIMKERQYFTLAESPSDACGRRNQKHVIYTVLVFRPIRHKRVLHFYLKIVTFRVQIPIFRGMINSGLYRYKYMVLHLSILVLNPSLSPITE